MAKAMSVVSKPFQHQPIPASTAYRLSQLLGYVGILILASLLAAVMINEQAAPSGAGFILRGSHELNMTSVTLMDQMGTIFSLKILLTIGHVLGLALGMGAALFLDMYLLQFVWHRPIDKKTHEIALFGSKLVSIGLSVLWLTGFGFFLYYYFFEPVNLTNPKIWVKLSIVALLTLNGMALHSRVLPKLKNKIGVKIFENESLAGLREMQLTAVISIVTWTFALVLGLTKGLNFSISGLTMLWAYAIACFVGFVLMQILYKMAKNKGILSTQKRSYRDRILAS